MDNIFEQINKSVDNLEKKFKTVGISIALYNDHEIIYTRQIGYANKELKTLVDKDTMFMIGSNTKILTALAIMKLYEEGKLLLDNDIKTYLPDFSIKSRFTYDKITITDLLSHRSGLPCDNYELLVDETHDYHEIINILKDTYMTNKPGVMFSYSNLGYGLLGLIIEKVSGIPYEKYLEEVIFKPLKMATLILPTKVSRDKVSRDKDLLALSYDGKGLLKEDPLAVITPAGSNTYAKISDGVTIGQLFLNKGLINGYRLLKEETIELMMSKPIYSYLDSKEICGGYGLLHNNYTFGLELDPVLGHGGDTIYHHSVINFIPKANIGITIYTNSSSGLTLSRYMMISILSEYLGSLGYKIPKELSIEHPEASCEIDSYLGKYVYNGGLFEIKLNKKGQLITTLSGAKVTLKPCQDDYLQCLPNSLLIKLIKPIKNIIMGQRFKLVVKEDETYVLLESTIRNQKNLQAFASKYIETTIPTSWESYLGTYEIVNPKLKTIFSKLTIEKKNGYLVLSYYEEKRKQTLYLLVINDYEAIIQGFGRSTCNTVIISEKGDKKYLEVEGILGYLINTNKK